MAEPPASAAPIAFCVLGSGDILKIDKEFHVVATTNVYFWRSTNVAALTPDGKHLFVGGYANDVAVYRVDTTSMTADAVDVSHLPQPPSEASWSAAAIVAPRKDLIYYRGIGFPRDTPNTFLMDLTSGDVKTITQFELRSPDCTSMSPDGRKIVLLGSSVKLIDAFKGEVLWESRIGEYQIILKQPGNIFVRIEPGSVMLHGAITDWNAERVDLWCTRWDDDGKETVLRMNVDLKAHQSVVLSELSPWPAARFEYRHELSRNGRSHFIALLNGTSARAKGGFGISRPVLTLPEASLIAKEPLAFWNSWPKNYGGCFITPDAKYAFIGVVENGKKNGKTEGNDSAVSDETTQKHILVIKETKTWNTLASIPIKSSVIQVLFKANYSSNARLRENVTYNPLPYIGL